MSPEASRRVELASEDLVRPVIESTGAANDSNEDDLIDYRIPDVATRRAPIPPTPVAAFPAQSNTFIQPNTLSAEELDVANKTLSGTDLELLENSGNMFKGPDLEAQMAPTKTQAETIEEMLKETDYDKNLRRISERTKPGVRIPDGDSDAVTSANLTEAKVTPITKTVSSTRPPSAGLATVKPGELKAVVQKPSFLKRLFG